MNRTSLQKGEVTGLRIYSAISGDSSPRAASGAGVVDAQLQFPELSPSSVPTVPLAQLADKVCAIFERHGNQGAPSSRARDLADIAMIAAQKTIEGTSLVDRLQREQDRRLAAGTLHQPLPKAFSLDEQQRAEWPSRWRKATRNAPISFEEAEQLATASLNPALSGEARGSHWNPNRLEWQ